MLESIQIKVLLTCISAYRTIHTNLAVTATKLTTSMESSIDDTRFFHDKSSKINSAKGECKKIAK